MLHLADGLFHAAGNDLIAVLPTPVQTLAQRLQVGWQDEDRTGFGHQLAHLTGALPVDFQNQVIAPVQHLLQRATRGAVEVAEHFGVFKEVVLVDQRLEFVMADEVVVDAVLLARAFAARGVRDRNADAFVVLDQGVDQAGLAGT
ncbi:hypothetical protein D3C75_1102230 [compost metagenome]